MDREEAGAARILGHLVRELRGAAAPVSGGLARSIGDKVEFIGVNVTVNQTPERVRRYVSQHDVPFRVLYDDKGTSTRAYQAPATSYRGHRGRFGDRYLYRRRRRSGVRARASSSLRHQELRDVHAEILTRAGRLVALASGAAAQGAGFAGFGLPRYPVPLRVSERRTSRFPGPARTGRATNSGSA